MKPKLPNKITRCDNQITIVTFILSEYYAVGAREAIQDVYITSRISFGTSFDFGDNHLYAAGINPFKARGRILVQVTIYRRLLIGRDGHLGQSEAYYIS